MGWYTPLKSPGSWSWSCSLVSTLAAADREFRSCRHCAAAVLHGNQQRPYPCLYAASPPPHNSASSPPKPRPFVLPATGMAACLPLSLLLDLLRSLACRRGRSSSAAQQQQYKGLEPMGDSFRERLLIEEGEPEAGGTQQQAYSPPEVNRRLGRGGGGALRTRLAAAVSGSLLQHPLLGVSMKTK